METASIAEIKKELKTLPQSQLIDYCARLMRFRKDNKELLHYLVFESHNESGYIEDLKLDIANGFAEINLSSLYYAKKSIRKILRYTVKHIRYSGLKTTEVELLIYFCHQMRNLPIPIGESRILLNIYNRQIQNIQKAWNALDEDLQFDYMQDVEDLKKPFQR